MDQNDQNIDRCPHSGRCSQSLCPLDPDLSIRVGNVQDSCRFMRPARLVTVKGKQFTTGGTVIPDTIANFVPSANIMALNEPSRKHCKELGLVNNDP